MEAIPKKSGLPMSTHPLHLCPRPRSLTIGAGTYHINSDAYIPLG